METKELDLEEQQWSIELSKKVLYKYVTTGQVLDINTHDVIPRLQAKQSCFVTYHKNDQLRGCIGSIIATQPLYKEIIQQSISAAVKDPRFPPITEKELPFLRTEITVLSPPVPIANADFFEPGQHGIIFSLHHRRSVFLPQVAEEQGWGREETLEHLAVKAGFKRKDWQHKEASFQVFTAQKIIEN